MRFNWITGLVAAILLIAPGCGTHGGEYDMQERPDSSDGFFEFAADRPANVNIQPQPIRTGTAPPRDRAPLPSDRSIPAQYANQARNSRIPANLPNGKRWRIQWTAQLGPAIEPAYLVYSDRRLVVAGPSQWALIDHTGHLIGNLLLHASTVTIDSDQGMFYSADRYGYMVGRRLSDGEEAHGVYGHFGPQFARDQIIRRGNRLLIVSTQMPPDPFSGTKAELSMVELHELGNPITLDRDKIVTSDKMTVNLIRKTPQMLSAFASETLVLAPENRLYILDAELNFKAAVAGEFVPISLSLDELGNIHTIVREAEKLSLCVVDPSGSRFLSVPVADHYEKLVVPPVIGFDHRIYLVTSNEIMAIEPTGKIAWEKAVPQVSGGSVTANDYLMISSGSRVLAFGPDGRESLIFDTGGEPLTTPPILHSDGVMFVASAKAVYCVAPDIAQDR